MPQDPLSVFDRIDPDFLQNVNNTRDLALSDGALPKKFKLLIAMSLDAAAGTIDGVKSLAQAALAAGATKEEIAETLRVTQYISGVGSTYVAARALAELF
ncbi:carboxymuconolactone decarboxylase family protein [Chloroflexota bacterium]